MSENTPNVIHTVGPVARGHVGKSQRELLKDCYQNSLKLIKDQGLRSVAFPCISTGIYGFPNEPAAEIALMTVKTWLKKNCDEWKNFAGYRHAFHFI
ncbi:hypothetical protein AAFF_G00170390 [Aldrovandia affinis]|uniref:Macro domain-containing protein n=1 Tax=Aldrovandia affinis TaxID=143900 RepID=A0AAD7W7A8_9TELE|nr:hypothetical protein AAFF_G00170390 [Aldrovandia affinis]